MTTRPRHGREHNHQGETRMHATRFILHKMATVISHQGLHTGEQFGAHGPMDRLDICAIAYTVAEGSPAPEEFFTDEADSSALIESSPRAMAAIKAISDVLDTDVNDTDGQPDYIEHVSVWTMTPPLGATRPPTTSEVIGRILRAAHHARSDAA